jgi:acyl-CoA hydrolase
MHIGDVSRCDAVVTFAAGAAVEVLVQVYREDLVTGESHRTNKSRLWYVQCKQVKVEVGDDDGEAGAAKEKSKARHVVHKFVPVSPVPDVVGLTEEERAAGAKRYADHRRSMRVDDPAETAVGADDDWKFEQLRLSQLMLPSDATASGIVFGGTLFSCAFHHCQSYAGNACDEYDGLSRQQTSLRTNTHKPAYQPRCRYCDEDDGLGSRHHCIQTLRTQRRDSVHLGPASHKPRHGGVCRHGPCACHLHVSVKKPPARGGGGTVVVVVVMVVVIAFLEGGCGCGCGCGGGGGRRFYW